MKKLNFNGRSSLDGDQLGNWRSRVAALVGEKGAVKVSDTSRPTSSRTKVELNQNAQRVFGWLRKDLGFSGLSNPYHLAEKHMLALARHITGKKEKGEIGAAMAAGYATICRHLARWIDKPELLKVFNNALGKDVCKRSLIAERDKSWEAASVNLVDKLIEVLKFERWVGLSLLCQHTFGHRKMEVLMFQPLKDIRPVPHITSPLNLDKKGRPISPDMSKVHWSKWGEGVDIHIIRGTKGKRPRVLHVKRDNDRAKETAWLIRHQIQLSPDRETLGPPFFTLQHNARTYERVLRKFGITQKALGITGHGLRAGFACDMLESFGITPTVRGGNAQHPDPAVQRHAYKETTEALGHGRISVVGAYAGSITPQAAVRQKKARERQSLREAQAQGPSAAEEMAGLVTQWGEQHQQPVTQNIPGLITQFNRLAVGPISSTASLPTSEHAP
jgi:hypothetical protein